MRQAYREGQEDQLGALGLVLNAIVVWNTRYMGLALDDLRSAGMPINPEDVERLSPLLHHHIHLDGRYTFALPEAVAHGELRPLRDANDPAEQVFDLLAASACYINLTGTFSVRFCPIATHGSRTLKPIVIGATRVT